MAKELKKVQKEFADLCKEGDNLGEEYKALSTNRQHFAAMIYEASEAITREVTELKKSGKQGATLKDFEGEKEVKAILSEVVNLKKQTAATAEKYGALHKKCQDVKQRLLRMEAELDEEIQARKKKKDRKVFAIDSKSLPDLENLAKEIHGQISDFGGEVADLVENEAAGMSEKKIDDLMEKAVTASPEQRASKDQASVDNRALDLRILGRNTKRAQKLRDDVKAQLTETLKLLKNGQRDAARDALDKATSTRAELQEIAETYERAMKGINRYDLESMKQSKDGKAILAAIELINKLDAAAGKELDTILSKVKF